MLITYLKFFKTGSFPCCTSSLIFFFLAYNSGGKQFLSRKWGFKDLLYKEADDSFLPLEMKVCQHWVNLLNIQKIIPTLKIG